MPATYDDIYREAIKNGASERFADMLASRSPPRGMTDSVAVAGVGKLSDQFRDRFGNRGQAQLKKIIASAKKHGYNPSPNDIYQPGLAEFPGDPKAFCPSGAGYLGHVKKVCEERGVVPHSADVKVNRRMYQEEPKNIPLAEDLIQKLTPEVLEKDPQLKRKKPREIREAVIAKHGSP